MVDSVYYVTISLFFDTPLLYYYINLRSPIILCLFSEDIYLFFGIFLPNSMFSVSFLTVPELFCDEVLETFVTLSAILFPIK